MKKKFDFLDFIYYNLTRSRRPRFECLQIELDTPKLELRSEKKSKILSLYHYLEPRLLDKK